MIILQNLWTATMHTPIELVFFVTDLSTFSINSLPCDSWYNLFNYNSHFQSSLYSELARKKRHDNSYVMVSDPGPFSLNCLFLAICPYFKVIQLFLKVFHLPGYMVGRCGEQFCEQDLLSGPLCCQKSLDSTPKSVQLYALPNLICSSEPIFLHSNQN